MKNLKTIITVIALSLSTVFSVAASDNDNDKDKKSKVNTTLRSEIVSLLGDRIPVEIKKESSAKVSFIVNRNNELVVISVDSKIYELKSFLKNKLNYKKLNVKGVKKGEIYRMPIKIKQS